MRRAVLLLCVLASAASAQTPKSFSPPGRTAWTPDGCRTPDPITSPLASRRAWRSLHSDEVNTDEVDVAYAPSFVADWVAEPNTFNPTGPVFDDDGNLYFVPLLPYEDVALISLDPRHRCAALEHPEHHRRAGRHGLAARARRSGSPGRADRLRRPLRSRVRGTRRRYDRVGRADRAPGHAGRRVRHQLPSRRRRHRRARARRLPLCARSRDGDLGADGAVPAARRSVAARSAARGAAERAGVRRGGARRRRSIAMARRITAAGGRSARQRRRGGELLLDRPRAPGGCGWPRRRPMPKTARWMACPRSARSTDSTSCRRARSGR